MGLVRTKNRVVVGEWNHLTVRRRDWKGFVQLNNGPETGTLSKVSLLAVGFQCFFIQDRVQLCYMKLVFYLTSTSLSIASL